MIFKRITSLALGLLVMTPHVYSMSFATKCLHAAQPVAQFCKNLGSFCLKPLTAVASYPKTTTALVLGATATAGLLYTLIKRNSLLTKTLEKKYSRLNWLLRGLGAQVPQSEHIQFAQPLLKAIGDKQFDTANMYIQSGVKVAYSDDNTQKELIDAIGAAANSSLKAVIKEAVNKIEAWTNAGINLEHFGATQQTFLNIFETLVRQDLTQKQFNFYYHITQTLIDLKATFHWSQASQEQQEKATKLMHTAIALKLDDVFKLMIQAEFDINAPNMNKETPLHNIINRMNKRMDASLVEFICSQKKSLKVDTRDGKGQTALFVAASKGYTRIVQLLLEAGADIDARDNNGVTPLMAAVTHAQDDTVRFLLEHNAMDLKDNSGKTALMHIPTTIKRDKEDEKKDKKSDQLSPIFELISMPITGQDYQGNPMWAKALWHIEAFTPCMSILNRLLASCDAKLTDNDGKTFMHHLAGTDLSLMIHYAQHIMNEDNLTNLGKQPEVAATLLPSMAKLKKITQELLPKLFSPDHISATDVQDKTGYTPLSQACETGDYPLAKQLVSNKAQVNIQTTDDKKTPLMLALHQPAKHEIRQSLVKTLLQVKPDLTKQDKDHHNAFWYSRVIDTKTNTIADTTMMYKLLQNAQ